eukprot:TRINITY_DN2618_c1_g1_i2.p2 TRINITY_DN2618_c1_g1~~TRINITY_DN2618_c1_g1_i2.p2  ORF type:complete len:320 (-),score=74.79 TRINITY_DN2618_c1_g1_i2:1638-2597(-)
MSDDLTQYLKLRLTSFEKSMKQLEQDTAWVLHKQDSIGIRSEKLANDLKLYAGIETQGLKDALTRVGNLLITQEDARLRMHDRYEFNFVPVIREMPLSVKGPRELVNKRESQLKKLTKLQINYNKEAARQPVNRPKCDQLNGEVMRLSNELKTTNQTLIDSITKFETHKIANMKKALGEHLHSQLMFHARAMEALTEAIDIVHSIDDETEIDEVLEKVNMVKRGTGQAGQTGADQEQRAQVSTVSGADVRAHESQRGNVNSQQNPRTTTATTSRPGYGRRHSREGDFNTDEDDDLLSDDEVQGFDSDDDGRRGASNKRW